MADGFKFSDLFKSKVISTTNPRGDIKSNYGKDVATQGNEFNLTGIQNANLSKLVSTVRDGSFSETIYDEYDDMEAEVIINASLKTYSDDATTIDPTQKRITWITSEDSDLAEELNTVLDTMKIDEKSWGMIYNIAKYGDFYLENIYNEKGYMIGVKTMSRPQDVYHLVVDSNESGYLVRRDPRKVVNAMGSFGQFDVYHEGKFTHFFTSDSPRLSDLVVDIQTEDGEMDFLQFEVARGRSMIEPVRMNYRILRLLEDTMITNKIARSEYFRIVNIEVGDASGRESNNVVRKVKRLFDSKPKFDGSKGQYSSEKVYRPSADVLVNSTNQGTNAISINEIGGQIETQHMADVDYFKNKLFTGLQIPKAFLGFEESVSGGMSDGGGTLAKLDIRYSRAVRRLQKSFMAGVEDLLLAYLVSRGRDFDAGNFNVNMNNPSSAEELSRLDELSKRVELITQVMDSVGNISDDTANLPELYLGLVETFVDDSQLVELFEDVLTKSVAMNYLRLNASKSQLRTEMMSANTSMISMVNELEDVYREGEGDPSLDSEDFDDGFSSSGGGFSSGGDGFSDSGFDDLGGLGDDLDSGMDELFDDEGIEEIEGDELTAPMDGEEIDLDDLDTENQSFIPVHDAFADRTGVTAMLDSLSSIATYGPSQFANEAMELSSLVAQSGVKYQDKCSKFISKVDNYYSDEVGLTDKVLLEVNESMVTRDTDKRKKLIRKLLSDDEE